MPQYPLNLNAQTPAGALAPFQLDNQSALQTSTGGISTALNLTAGAHLVKNSAGRIVRLVVSTAGTAGTFAVNDAATTGGVAASNLVAGLLNTTAAGTVITLEFPCANGIVVTVPTTGVVSVSFS